MSPSTDMDSIPNDSIDEQLVTDLQAVRAIEQELTGLVGAENRAARWLHIIARILQQNIGSAKAHRVYPLPNLSAKRIQQDRKETLKHSQAHTKEAKATLQWYKENPKERRDQLPPWLKTRADALFDLHVLLWRWTPEGHLATAIAELEGLRKAVKENDNAIGSPLQERYEACVAFTELMKEFLKSDDPTNKSRLMNKMQAIADEEIAVLKNMRQPTSSAEGQRRMPKQRQLGASPLTGQWKIVSMTQWDRDYIDAEVPGFFEFEAEGKGRFQFGYVKGDLDGKIGIRDHKPAIEFSWEGTDETDPAQGRGWAVLEGDELHGMIFFHGGDDSEFVAKKKGGKKKPKK